MSLATLLVVAVGLAMDAFSVAVAASAQLDRLTGRRIFRFAFHFGLFQAVMPLLGWLSGRSVSGWVQAWDHWVAFALLWVVGGKALWEGIGAVRSGERGEAALGSADPTRGWSLVLLSVATSIDAFAVGLSFAVLGAGLWVSVLVIGGVTGGLTVVGMLLGRSLGAWFGRGASVLGGILLLGIGLKILVEHLGR